MILSNGVIIAENFETGFINQNWLQKMTDKKQKRLEDNKEKNYDMYLSDIIRKEDGGFVFIAEQVMLRKAYEGRESNPEPKVYLFYNHDDIIVADIDSNLEFNWVEKILKN